MFLARLLCVQGKEVTVKFMVFMLSDIMENFRLNYSCDFLLTFNVCFLARLREVHRAIAVTPVVHLPVPVHVFVTLALKFSRSPYLDNHSSESIHTWTIDTL